MGSILWGVVAALVVVWVLALTSVFQVGTTVIWIVLVAAILLSLLAFLTGGFLGD